MTQHKRSGWDPLPTALFSQSIKLCIKIEGHSLIEIDNSDEDNEMGLMVLTIQVLTQKRKRRKRAVWVQEIYRDRETEVIRILANKIKVSNREQYLN